MTLLHRFLPFAITLALPALQTTAGEKNTYTLHGYMGVQGGESFHYDLQMTDSAGHISGYAYTSSDNAHVVKAYFEGTLDRKARNLTLQEKRIESSNHFTSHVIICLVNAVLNYDAAAATLSGPLKSLTTDNGNCASGSITFSNPQEVQQLWADPHPDENGTPVVASSAQPAVGKKVPVAVKPVPAPAAPVAPPAKPAATQTAVKPPQQPAGETKGQPPVITKITEGKDVVYHWHSPDIVLEIWDGGIMDYDRVNIHYNGTPILNAYTLEKRKKKLVFPVGGNELNIISIEALNEGNESPNTANITLWDGDTSYEILANNPTGKTALIKITKSE